MVTWCLVDDFANPFCRVGWEKWSYVCVLMTFFMCLLYRLENRNRIAPFLYRLEAPRFLCGLFQEGLRRPWLKRGERQQRPCFSFQPPYLRCTTAHSSKSSSEYETRTGVERTSSLPFFFYHETLSFFFPFQEGEVIRPLDPTLSSDGALPPPLIPLPKRRASDCEPVEEEEGREAPTLPQDLGVSVGLDLGKPEVAVEAYGEMGGSPVQESEQDLSDTELENTGATLASIYFHFPSVLFFFS